MTIVFCGPPHSGKSVLIANLKRRLPDDCQRVLRACPDGEGDWSNEIGNFNADVRHKGAFTSEFIERFCDAIDNNKESKIVIVDVGGRRTKENEEIFSHCDSYVVLCNSALENNGEMQEWQNFADAIIKKGTESEHLDCFALLDSKLDGTEEIYASNDNFGPLRGMVVGLERKTVLNESAILDKIAAKIIKESGYTIEDSRNLNLHNLNGIALAYCVGCQKTEFIEDVEVPKAFWEYDSCRKIYDVITTLVNADAKKDEEVNINAIRPAFILSASVKALQDNGIEKINTMDVESNSFVQIKRIQMKDGIREADGLSYHVIEGKNSIFLDLDIVGQKYTLEEYENCVLPKLNQNKQLFISGRVPNWLMASIATSYDSVDVSILQPPKGFVCTCSKDEKKLGTLMESIPGINLDKYFEDKKIAMRDKVPFDFSNEAYLIDEKMNDEEI